MSALAPGTDQIWAWLGEVADPEIPVISVVDLGIVRDVALRDGECVVTITKYDEERGRVAGTYRTQVTGLVGGETVTGELIGCFKAKRQQLGPD